MISLLIGALFIWYVVIPVGGFILTFACVGPRLIREQRRQARQAEARQWVQELVQRQQTQSQGQPSR